AGGFVDFCRRVKKPISVDNQAWLEDDRVVGMTRSSIKYLYKAYLNIIGKNRNRLIVSKARTTIAFHELLWFVEKRVPGGRRKLSSWIKDDKLGKLKHSKIKYSDVLRKFQVQ
ncbi:hypothetical protein KAT92_02735, partial [Candidatus Babeliales bacterium]|nr:hypothetical protein [Candidatus Babeliales bacterium]